MNPLLNIYPLPRTSRKVVESIYYDVYVKSMIEDYKREVQTKKIMQSTWKDLVSPQFKNRLIIGCMLQFLQQFSGINTLVFYSSQ